MSVVGRIRGGGSTTVAGFTMLEFMVATALFLIVGGAAFSLFRQHAPIFNEQENLANVNIQLQSAVTQLQQDLVNAGTGYYTGANIASWPVGVSIINSDTSNGDCFNAATFTYGPTCFDTPNVMTADPSTPPAHPANSTGASCVNTYTNSSAVNPLPGPVYAVPVSPTTAAQLAADYHTGDELMLVTNNMLNVGAVSIGAQYTTIVLTAPGAVSGSEVSLQYNLTAATGTNTTANDPLGITTNVNANLATQFCPTDWILKLKPTTYQVNTSTASNPQLTRSQSGTTAVVANQIIGFRVGAALWNTVNNTTDFQTYNYNASTYGGTNAYNFTLVRSVRVSLIARTAPGTNGLDNFQNSFDGGPYEILPAAVIVNPRNLSMDGLQ